MVLFGRDRRRRYRFAWVTPGPQTDDAPYGVIVLFGRSSATATSNGKVASNRATSVINLVDKLWLLPFSLPAGPADRNITELDDQSQVKRYDRIDGRIREDKRAISGIVQCQLALALEATVR